MSPATRLRLIHGACITLIVLTLSFTCRAAEARDPEAPLAPLNEQLIRIPGEEPPAVTLQVTVFRPAGNGPFPLAIMNHGATNASMGHRGERYRLTNGAFYFLSRGYAVALPMMRGFASSGGELYHFGCDLAATGTAYAKDIRAVIRYMGVDPRFDTERVVVAGQSYGGWNTLAVGALNMPNVKGLISFNGGIKTSECKAGESSLAAAAATFGAKTTVPSIWFYGDNDELFPAPVWRAMYNRYNGSGGHAQVVDIGVFMKDSHGFLAYPEALPLWVPKVDAFLARIGMPYAEVNRGYLPEPFPATSSFAALNEVAAIPYLSDKARDLYKKFLEKPFPRAFVINERGGASSYNGGFDPLGRALAACKASNARCATYAVDDRVVWTPLPTLARERAYALTIKADQTTTLEFSYRLNPDCSPKSFSRFKVVQPPERGNVEIGPKNGFPHFPANSPFAVCNQTPARGIGVSYTPPKGFVGQDTFSFRDEGADEKAPVVKMSLTIK